MSGFSTLTLYLLVTGQRFFFSWKKKYKKKEKDVGMQTLISIPESVVDSMYIFSYQFQNTKLSNQAENTAAIYYHIVKF